VIAAVLLQVLILAFAICTAQSLTAGGGASPRSQRKHR